MSHEKRAADWPSPGTDVFGRPIITIEQLAAMTPEERIRIHEERWVRDLSTLPPDVLDRLLIGEEELAERSASLDEQPEQEAAPPSDGRRAS